jgi:hypothetical protein
MKVIVRISNRLLIGSTNHVCQAFFKVKTRVHDDKSGHVNSWSVPNAGGEGRRAAEHGRRSKGPLERAIKVPEEIFAGDGEKITEWQAAEKIGIRDRSMRCWRERYQRLGFDVLMVRQRAPLKTYSPTRLNPRIIRVFWTTVAKREGMTGISPQTGKGSFRIGTIC